MNIGLDSSTDPETVPKGGTFIEMVSLALYVIVSLRIIFHKKTSRVLPAPSSVYKTSTLTSLEKQTIADISSNFFVIVCFASYFFVITKLKNMDYSEFNFYPNYLYIYFHQLLWAATISLAIALVYYIRHRPLRDTILKEIKMIFHCDQF